jgi:hypothetical protein
MEGAQRCDLAANIGTFQLPESISKSERFMRIPFERMNDRIVNLAK